jgi:proliferating cell nuclear antigen PCNA
MQLKDSKLVKGIFETVSSVLSEVRLKIDPVIGLSITGMDGSHICLCNFVLAKADLDVFETDQTYELGVNLLDLMKVIKRCNAKDEITFSHDPKDKRLIIAMKLPEGKKVRRFTLQLIDIESEEINMDQLNAMQYENHCTLNCGFISEAIKDAEIYCEVLTIKTDKLLQFSTEGSVGDMVYELGTEELKESAFTVPSEGTFAIHYLTSILKVQSLTEELKIELKSDSPIKLSSMFLNASKVQYFLAPRVENDGSGTMTEE